MVVFTCQHCGDPLHKPKVEKHYQTKCRFKTPSLTCVDCMKDFIDGEYTAHTQCVSEAERYSAKGTVIKEFVGRKKQEKYVQMIQNLLNCKNCTGVQRELLEICSTFDNVPRKLIKFKNFMKNVARKAKYTEEDLNSVFKILENAWKNDVQTANSNGKHQEEKDNSKIREQLDVDCNEQECMNVNLIKLNKNDNKKSCTTKNDNENLQREESGDNMLIECDKKSEDSKENNDGLSKKQLKKQKKYKKYLAELENESKFEKSENINNLDSFCDGYKKSKKKNKSSKTDKANSNISEVDRQDSLECTNVGEIVLKGRNKQKSSKRKMDDSICEISEKKQRGEPVEGEEQITSRVTFDWADVILKVLQSRPDKELSLKRLAKKVINEYQTIKSDHHTYEELMAKFNKKVKKTIGVRVLKDKVKLAE